jgi:adenylate cyclase, class 2
MSDEIEAKIKVPDLAAIRARLQSAGAQYKKKELETNSFYDTANQNLRMVDRGLRIREAVDEQGNARFLITMKGPMKPGQFKTREEIQFSIDQPQPARDLFRHLGYEPTLSFQKRRETWMLDDCEVELDELPYLGTYVEIEGEERAIPVVREKLGLAGVPLISTGYISLLWRYLEEHRITNREIRF